MLQLNYDCQMKILAYLSPIELCAVAETCNHLRNVACDAFKIQLKLSTKSYHHIIIDDDLELEFLRILEHFGSVISSARITGSDVEGSTWKMALAFDCLERYCTGTLHTLMIDGSEEIFLPPSLMSTVKKLKTYSPIQLENFHIALSNCKELVELDVDSDNLISHEVLSCIWNSRFIHLKKLECADMDTNEDFYEIEEFFQNHTQLTALVLHFVIYDDDENHIDLSFIKNLLHLETLKLLVHSSNIDGIDAMSHLHNLQEFCLSGSDVETYTKSLNSLASVHSLTLLDLCFYQDVFGGISEVGGVIQSVNRFKNLATLAVTSDFDFSAFEPKKIVELIRNLTNIERLDLECVFESKLDETFFVDLAKVCASQQRKITLFIDAEKVDDRHTKFFEKFNKKYAAFVEIKVKSEQYDPFNE